MMVQWAATWRRRRGVLRIGVNGDGAVGAAGRERDDDGVLAAVGRAHPMQGMCSCAMPSCTNSSGR